MQEKTPTPAQADEKALEAAEKAYLQPIDGGGFAPNMRAAIMAYLATLRPEHEAVAWRYRLKESPIWTVRNIPPENATGQFIVEPLFASPPAPAGVKVKSEPAAHSYSPDYQAMGDCRVCGHQPENCTGRSSLLPSSPEAQAGSPAEALLSQSGVDVVWFGFDENTEEFTGEYSTVKPHDTRGMVPFMRALAKPVSEPAGGGVRERIAGPTVAMPIKIVERLRAYRASQPYDPVLSQIEIDMNIALSSPASSSPAEAEALPDGVEATATELLSHLKLYVMEKLEPHDADMLHDRMFDLTRALSPAPAQAGSGDAGEER